MPDKDELLERLEDLDVPQDVIDGFRAEFDSSGLRKKIGEYERRWKEEAEPALSFKKEYELLPKRKAALEPFDIDYEKSPKYLKTVFNAMDPKKLDDQEYVSQYLRDNDVEVNLRGEQEQGEEEPQGGRRMVEHALAAPLTGARTGPLTPKDFATWDYARQKDFIRKHPREYEALTRGEAVTV